MMVKKCRVFRAISITLLAVLVLILTTTAGFALAAPAQQEVIVSGNDWVDWFAVAAQTIGVDYEHLLDEVFNGKSIAQVATEKGVDPQQVIDAIVAAETEWANRQVAGGNFTQEEAGFETAKPAAPVWAWLLPKPLEKRTREP